MSAAWDWGVGTQGMRVRPEGPQLISEMVRKYLNIDCSVLMGANIAKVPSWPHSAIPRGIPAKPFPSVTLHTTLPLLNYTGRNGEALIANN